MGRGKILAFSITMFILAGAIYTYFFIISPTFVAKPTIEKPALSAGEPVEEEHIQYLINELGAYKLHNPPLSDKTPVIEVLVTNPNQYFTVTVEGNVPKTTPGRADDPDIRISGSSDAVVQLLSAGDIAAESKKLSDEGKITVEVLKDMPELVAMGYKALYDELT